MTDFNATNPPTDGGYILLFRKLLNNPTFKSDFEAMTFAWLVLRASWRDVTVRYKDRAIHLRRGQLAISVRDIAMKMDRSRQWADRFLSRLTQAGMIETSTETGVNVVTISNYDLYQRRWDGAETPAGTRPGQDRDTSGTQNNELNERKEGKEKKGASFSLPDWVDPEVWADWERYRKEIKKPLTNTARQKAMVVLAEARAKGYQPREVIDRSINANWQGLFVPDRPRSTMTTGAVDQFGMQVKTYTEAELRAHNEFMKGVI